MTGYQTAFNNCVSLMQSLKFLFTQALSEIVKGYIFDRCKLRSGENKKLHEFTDASLHLYSTATYKLSTFGTGYILATAWSSKHVISEQLFVFFRLC